MNKFLEYIGKHLVELIIFGIIIIMLIIPYFGDYKKISQCTLWEQSRCDFLNQDTGICYHPCGSINKSDFTENQLAMNCEQIQLECIKKIDVYINKKYLKK